MAEPRPSSRAGGKSGRPSSQASLMYVRCATCGDWFDSRPGPVNAISHGLCPECFAIAMRGWDGDDADAAPPRR